MFGPGVSTMPSETSAKPSRAEMWGMRGLAEGCAHVLARTSRDVIAEVEQIDGDISADAIGTSGGVIEPKWLNASTG